MDIIKNKKGFGLAETIIALFVIVLAITGAISLSIHVSKTFARSGIEILATSYAIDAIEQVRNIRDTNWLYYGESQARQRWGELSVDPDTLESYKNGNYILSICIPGEQCDSLAANTYDPVLVKVSDSTNPDDTIWTDDDLLLYNDEVSDNGETATIINQYIDPPESATSAKYGFRRMITLKYLDNDFDLEADQSLDDNSTANAVLVTSRVNWRTETLGLKRSIVVETVLSDWYKRKDHIDIPL
jgi:type II secretory pathway pseudopilin PulG